MRKKTVEQRIIDLDNEYELLMKTAVTPREKERLQIDLDLAKRRINFGEELQKRRLETNREQKEIAALSGISESYIKQIEAGGPPIHNTPQTVDKIVDCFKGWSREQAYRTLGIKNKPRNNVMTVGRATKEFADALVNSPNSSTFVLRILDIKTKFEIDYRKKNPGEFLKLQEAYAILFDIKDYSAVQFAAAFLKIGLKANLTQTQWENIFRICKDVETQNILKIIGQALTRVIDENESEQITKSIKLKNLKPETASEDIGLIKKAIGIQQPDWADTAFGIFKNILSGAPNQNQRDVFQKSVCELFENY